MKKLTKLLAVFALLAGVLGVAANQKEITKADADWGNETVRVYLDKTVTIATLGWWQTNETWIHIWDGEIDHYQQMVEMNVNVFYYDVPGEIWQKLTDDTKGMEFYVYNTGSQQNQTEFTGGAYLKSNELNYFKLNSANSDAKQSSDKKNKEVEDTISGILSLNCDSTAAQVQDVVDAYNALRPMGKSNLSTWEVDAGVTWFGRLAMLSATSGATEPILPSRFVNNSKHLFDLKVVTLVGVLSLTALSGFYFLKTKKQ